MNRKLLRAITIVMVISMVLSTILISLSYFAY